MTSTDLISMEVEIKTEHVLLNASRYPIPIAVSLNPVWIEPILAANRINAYLVAFIHYYKITFLLWEDHLIWWMQLLLSLPGYFS